MVIYKYESKCHQIMFVNVAFVEYQRRHAGNALVINNSGIFVFNNFTSGTLTRFRFLFKHVCITRIHGVRANRWPWV